MLKICLRMIAFVGLVVASTALYALPYISIR
jgi:hypothetical protein